MSRGVLMKRKQLRVGSALFLRENRYLIGSEASGLPWNCSRRNRFDLYMSAALEEQL